MQDDSKFDCRCVGLVTILRQWKGNGKAECEELAQGEAETRSETCDLV